MFFSPHSHLEKISEKISGKISGKINSKSATQNSTSKDPIKAQPLRFRIGGLLLFLLNLFYCLPAVAIWGNPTCDVDAKERILKENLRKSLTRNIALYNALVAKHKDRLTICRNQDPVKTQALWLRLYPQDAKPEVLEDVLDRIANRGYNAVYVDVLYDGRILLPMADNSTPWRSLMAEAVKSGKVPASYDLWAEVIRKGRERGLRVYGTSTLGYGNQSSNRDETTALARTATNKTVSNSPEPKSNLRVNEQGQGFNLNGDRLSVVDPHNLRASDFSKAINLLVQRQPDGILFDYGLYPKGVGNVKDLRINGAARQALLEAMPSGTKELMAIYLETGKITSEAITSLHDNNQQKLGMVQMRSNPNLAAKAAEQISWQLALSHARQGISDLIDGAIANINLPSDNLKIGVVFPPNISTGKSGMSPRLQFWDRFPTSVERHQMTSTICKDGKCVADEVKKVVSGSSNSVPIKICPVLVGVWGQAWRGHSSLELQMQAIKTVNPVISCVSHFSYSWIEPDSDRQRQAGL